MSEHQNDRETELEDTKNFDGESAYEGEFSSDEETGGEESRLDPDGNEEDMTLESSTPVGDEVPSRDEILENSDDSDGTSFGFVPPLATYAVSKPKVEPVRLDPARVYQLEDESEDQHGVSGESEFDQEVRNDFSEEGLEDSFGSLGAETGETEVSAEDEVDDEDVLDSTPFGEPEVDEEIGSETSEEDSNNSVECFGVESEQTDESDDDEDSGEDEEPEQLQAQEEDRGVGGFKFLGQSEEPGDPEEAPEELVEDGVSQDSMENGPSDEESDFDDPTQDEEVDDEGATESGADDLSGESDQGEDPVEESEPVADGSEGQEPAPVEVAFHAPKVKPVQLNAAMVYPGKTEEIVDDPVIEDSLEAPESVEEEVPESVEEEVPESVEEEVPVEVPATAAVAGLVSSGSNSSSGKMEVLEPEEKGKNALAESHDVKRHSKWAFWKRPSKRDQQLARITEGYIEMVDLVRAIRDQMESQNENNLILRESLAHLPEAMKGLDSFSKSQHTVGEALKEIHSEMKNYSVKDEKLVDSMVGFNDTLKGMDDTSKATMQTFDRVQERMRDSDIRMENLFKDVQNTEEKVSDTMVRLQRNMAIMQGIFLVCLMVVIGVLIFTVMKKDNEEEPVPAPNIVFQAPAVAPPSNTGQPETPPRDEDGQ